MKTISATDVLRQCGYKDGQLKSGAQAVLSILSEHAITPEAKPYAGGIRFLISEDDKKTLIDAHQPTKTEKTDHPSRTLARAILKLYNEFGMTPTEGLEQLARRS